MSETRMRTRLKILGLLAFAVVAIAAFSAASFAIVSAAADKTSSGAKKEKAELYDQVELFADALSIIRSEYVDQADPKKLMYGAMRGMCESLDDFSQFMDPDEYDDIQLETKGEFGGVGIEVGMRDGILTVIAPISGTPAEAAGIQSGDKIVKIDGKITRSVEMTDAIKQMRGKPGTMVTFTIWREKENKVFDVPLKRAMIVVHSVKKAAFVDGKIGYIKLAEFQENTPADLDAALKKLEAEGMDALILDLRNNPGGLLDTAVDVAERFLDKDATIVSIRSRDKEQDVTFKSGGRFAHLGYPVVVLVNGGSASAAEIVAGAVQDNKRALVLGTKSFGKASVQTVIPLKDGSAVRLTTASYLTPSGKLIRGKGIVPDVVVEKEPSGKKEKKVDIFARLEGAKQDPAAEYAAAEDDDGEAPSDEEKPEEDAQKDNQLDAAIHVIKGMKVHTGGAA